jgi:hypothetical protein
LKQVILRSNKEVEGLENFLKKIEKCAPRARVDSMLLANLLLRATPRD